MPVIPIRRRTKSDLSTGIGAFACEKEVWIATAGSLSAMCRIGMTTLRLLAA